MRRTATLTMSTAAALLLMLTACGGSAEEEQSTDDGDAPQEQETRDQPGDRGSDEEPSGEASGNAAEDEHDVAVASVDASQVLAEQDYEPTRVDGTVSFGVHSLTVDDDTMTLRVVITPELEGDDDSITLSDIFGVRRFAPTLVDRENLKEYSIISEGAATWWHAEGLETDNGEPMVWWGVYAAPQDEIDSVDVRLRSDMPEFTDVPIEESA